MDLRLGVIRVIENTGIYRTIPVGQKNEVWRGRAGDELSAMPWFGVLRYSSRENIERKRHSTRAMEVGPRNFEKPNDDLQYLRTPSPKSPTFAQTEESRLGRYLTSSVHLGLQNCDIGTDRRVSAYGISCSFFDRAEKHLTRSANAKLEIWQMCCDICLRITR